MMLGAITEKDVQTGRQAATWEEAIRISAIPLLESGAVEERYVEAMIDSLHKNGPYIVLGKGIALAHARSEFGANRMALCFTTFHPGVPFQAGELDPIELIITLAATDDNSHLALLSELAGILIDEERLAKLFAAYSPAAFCALLESK